METIAARNGKRLGKKTVERIKGIMFVRTTPDEIARVASKIRGAGRVFRFPGAARAQYAKIGERVGEDPGINLLVSLDPDYPNKLLHDRQEECEEQHTDQDTQPFPVAMDQKWKSIPLSNSGDYPCLPSKTMHSPIAAYRRAAGERPIRPSAFP